MWSSEQEVDILQLKLGMYVARLDRPWEGTCFPIQGFVVKDREDIEKLSLYCERVYIDVYKSNASPPMVLKSPKGNQTNNVDGKKADLRKIKKSFERHAIENYPVTSSFKRETKRAFPILKNLEQEITGLLTPGGCLDKLTLKHIANSTSDLVESVIRNPDAMVWLCRVKNNNSMVYQHVLRLAILACVFGRQFGLNRFLLVDLTMALLMTGVGKSSINSKALKQYRFDFTPPEYKHHIDITLEKLNGSHLPGINLQDILLNYCERLDGSGFPNAKVSDDIPLLARIAGLIDYFEIQVNPFNCRYAKSPSEAITQLNKVKNILFDAILIQKFVHAIGIYPTGTLVELNDNRIGIVCSQSYEKRLRASVIPLTNRKGDKIDVFKVLDLTMPNQWQLSDSNLRIKKGLAITALDSDIVEEAHDWLFKKNFGTWGKVRNLMVGL